MDTKENFSWRENKSSKERGNKSPKRFLSLYWECCHVFSRVYKSDDGKSYQGNCPKCRIGISVPIGPDGTTRRCFKVQKSGEL